MTYDPKETERLLDELHNAVPDEQPTADQLAAQLRACEDERKRLAGEVGALRAGMGAYTTSDAVTVRRVDSPVPDSFKQGMQELASGQEEDMDALMFEQRKNEQRIPAEQVFAELDEMEQLRARLEAAEADTARLDWLEKQRAVTFGYPIRAAEVITDMELGPPQSQVMKIGLLSHQKIFAGATKRAAIDAAQQALRADGSRAP
jgi:hypothetical protein